jgi:sulfur carrier protein
MHVRIKEVPGNLIREIELPEDSTYETLLGELAVNPETVIILNEGKAVPFDETVVPGNINILKIALGG